MRVVAIIPARGGSKGLPRKNLRLLGGAPLIAWAIAAARDSSVVGRVLVSTDSEEIATAARRWGAEAPFLRPAELATDETPDLPVFHHALRWLEAQGEDLPDLVVHLRPTSPLRPRGLVDRGIERLVSDPTADSVRTVVPSGENPFKMWRLDPADGSIAPLLEPPIPQAHNAPRQLLPVIHWQTGHLDVIRTRTILEVGSMSGSRILSLLVDRRFVCDIDTEADLDRAQWLWRRGVAGLVQPANPKARRPRLLVLDFDGVLTDNSVWVGQDGTETVRCTRADGIGLARARAAGIEVRVLSTEPNPVVASRCAKLGVPCLQGLTDKGRALELLCSELGVAEAETAYLGNDLNDLGCLERVGHPWVVADAHPDLDRFGFRRTTAPGGRGAVRELCETLAKLPPLSDP